jgi:anion-transporting  ArsA/GET3 family ATPase
MFTFNFNITPDLKEIQMLLSEAIASITASDAELKKAQGEIVAKLETLQASIADLQNQLANAPLTAEQQAAVDAVAADAKALDDIVPDAPAPTPVPEPAP